VAPGRQAAARLRRRALFALAVAAAVAAASEAASFLALWALEGGAGGFRVVAQERQRQRGAVAGPAASAARASLPRDLAENALHSYLGVVGDPDQDPGFSQYGFWGALGPPPPRRDPAKLLVVVVGGSLAADFASEGGRRLEERLARAPEYAGRKIVVLNAAHGGHKQPQQLMCLAYLLALGAEMDVLVNLDGFNEVALDAVENGPQGVFPLYPRSWALQMAGLDEPGLLVAAGKVAYLRDERRALADRFSGPARRGMTGSLVWRQLDRVVAAQLARAQAEVARYRPRHRYRLTGPPRALASESEVYDELARAWEVGSLQLHRLCRANGIRYVHFLQPNQYVEGSKPLGADERKVAFRDDHPYRRGVAAGYPRLRERGARLRAQGVAFTDLTGIFAGRREALYVDDCCHVGPAGYALIADAVADGLLAPVASSPKAGPE